MKLQKLFLILLAFICFDLNAQTLTHKVRKGESIYSIARLYGTTARLIADINDFPEINTMIKLDQKIKIPAVYYEVKAKNREPKYITHTVKAGENYFLIARSYNLPVYDILKLNNIPGNDTPKVGRLLKIPYDENKTVQISEQELKTNRTSEDIIKPAIPSKTESGVKKSRAQIEMEELTCKELYFIKGIQFKPISVNPENIYYPYAIFYQSSPKKTKKKIVEDSTTLDKKTIKLKEVKIEPSKNKSKFGVKVDTFSTQKAQFQLFLANKKIEKNKYKKGYKSILESLKLDPNNIEALLLCGEVDLTVGFYQKAIESYDKVIYWDSLNYEAFYNRSVCYQRMGMLKEAEADIEQAIKIKKNDINCYIARANIYFLQRKYEAAIDNFNFVLLVKSNYELVFLNRGQCYAAINQHERAIEDYNEAIKLTPEHGYNYYLRGISKIANNDILNGCKDIQMSIELNYDEAKSEINKYCK